MQGPRNSVEAQGCGFSDEMRQRNLSVKLRIAPSARVHKETAGVLADKVQSRTAGRLPWDFGKISHD